VILRVSEELTLTAVLQAEWVTTSITTAREEAEEKVVDWLGRLRLLHGVPFEYLVPDEGLLRPETIRFFYVDRNWTDAAVDGAVAAGTVTGRDRREVQADHAALRGLVDDAERSQWVDPPATSTFAGPVTGFLLRSRAVSGWPGLHVHAFAVTGTGRKRVQRELRVLRIERLAPAVLLAMFEGVPDRVEIEEPRSGIQFGARSNRHAGEPAGSWWLDVRDKDTGVTKQPLDKERVPFRAGSAGVIHLSELRRRLLEGRADDLGTTLDSAELALQLLRFPYQQAFEGPGRKAPGGAPVVPGRPTIAAEVKVPWLVAEGSKLVERIEDLR
jgi:hypothetical protein